MKNDSRNKIHFIGIGGIGMSGLAEYYLKSGWKVNGSDLCKSHITERLVSLGAEIFYSHSAGNIDANTETVVYSSAVKDDNEELIEAKKRNIRTIKRAELLGEIVNDKFLIAVSGTHGKTTTTAMIGKVLTETGFDPMIFVGGNIPLYDGASLRFSNSSYAVVEADEYDRSFLTLKSDMIVITNIDSDHLDIYSDIEDIKSTFRQFCSNSKLNSKIVYCGDDNNATETVKKLNSEFHSYGFKKDNEFKISSYSAEKAAVHFSIEDKAKMFEDIVLNLPGKHNVLNATACFVVAHLMNIDFNDYKRSLSSFTTVDRRLQLKFSDKNLKVYDDYAHHPAEIEASILALKEFEPERKILVIFQPHLFTRTRDFYQEIAKSLSLADKVILLDIYPAREKPIENVTSRLIEDELRKFNSKINYIQNSNELIGKLFKTDLKNYMIVFQGAGDITELCDKFIKMLKQ